MHMSYSIENYGYGYHEHKIRFTFTGFRVDQYEGQRERVGRSELLEMYASCLPQDLLATYQSSCSKDRER